VAPGNTTLRYEPIRPLSREEALRQLALGGDAAVNAIYSIALNDDDDAFAEAICLDALAGSDAQLRSAAVGAIGEMTVYANRLIIFDLAESRLFQLRQKYPEISGRIQDALDDFELAKNRRAQSGDRQK
jgi:hypothetical protein